MMEPTYRAPFPWFGGKSRQASIVWDRLGPIGRYIEPFCGSCAVLLSNPMPAATETINDADGFLANFWRAVRLDPAGVATWADYPVSELDLIARHRWLCRQDFIDQLKDDPDYFDAKLAGWWLWGQCAWIGKGWGSKPQIEQLPHLGNAGMGINRKLPHLGDAGRGEYIRQMIQDLSRRLRDVRIACGDWTRVVGPSVLRAGSGECGIFLDPPYDDSQHDVSYAGGGGVWADVTAWCEEMSDTSNKIALCGYAGTWDAPEGWEVFKWAANGGYANSGDGVGKKNKTRETIWFSPACGRQSRMLFDGMTP